MDRTTRTRPAVGRAAAGIAAVAALVGLVSGCGDAADDAAVTTAPTGTHSTPTESADAAQGRVFTADPTITRPHAVPFTTWTPVGADRIAIGFETGSPECYGVDVSVTESAQAVVVELRSGARADAAGRMCTMIAVFGTLEVPLSSPVGERAVLSAV
ncbi:hypothetical protein ACTD5D_06660 [Nocardia takedensis]|uniref:hypothetical protein n=1 Tax=Nocardia takedensis TaxID=259390 RepID=UPI000317B569|nr:hypothetical protein [Nocardia takedensis]